jgi:dTDP-4-dehydrorhamnose reductase
VRILLTGRTGQVGWELERILPPLGEVLATDRRTLDLGDNDAIRRAVREAKPDVIVNAAAYTAVDRAESEPAVAAQLNAVAPRILAEEAARCRALLVHYSTDYIFDGRKGEPYLEDDDARPLNIYGRTKLEGEQAVAAAGARHLILRAAWVYAPRGRNFFLAIAAKARAGEPLRVVCDQQGVPTESRFIAESTRALIERQAEGTFHVVPEGVTTWHGFAKAIVARLGLDSPVAAISSAEHPSPTRRPTYSVLSNRKVASLLGAQPHWESLLDRCVQAFMRKSAQFKGLE